MGRRLAIKTHQPQHIISSTAKRAWDTAAIMANELKIDLNSIQTSQKQFHAWPDDLTQTISKCDNKTDVLMIVCHNPGMIILDNQLLKSNYFENIPTAGLVTLSIEIDHWQKILQELFKSELMDFDYPNLKP